MQKIKATNQMVLQLMVIKAIVIMEYQLFNRRPLLTMISLKTTKVAVTVSETKSNIRSSSTTISTTVEMEMKLSVILLIILMLVLEH